MSNFKEKNNSFLRVIFFADYNLVTTCPSNCKFNKGIKKILLELQKRYLSNYSNLFILNFRWVWNKKKNVITWHWKQDQFFNSQLAAMMSILSFILIKSFTKFGKIYILWFYLILLNTKIILLIHIHKCG